MRLLKLRSLIVFFFSSCLICLLATNLSAQYATQGSGRLRNQIWWFNWNNFSVANGVTKNFVTDDGLNINIVFSNVTNGSQLVPSQMNTWPGAVLHLLYNFTDPNIKPALFRSTDVGGVTVIRFTMAITATRNGTPVPFNFVTADAEASVSTEVTRFATSGSNWSIIEFFRNSGQTDNPVTGCGTNVVSLTRTYAGASQTGTSPILSTTASQSGTLTVTTDLNNSVNGGMAVAFGIYAPIDRGDLPASYGFAQHQLGYNSVNGCNFNPPYPTTIQDTRLKIGNVAGDADNIQSLDDNADNIDEEGVSSFPMYNGSGQYTLQIPIGNSTGSTAYLSGWFDFNRDGSFSQNEFASVTVLNGATTTPLTWTGIPANLQSGSVNQFGFRFRLSSSQPSVGAPTGTSPDGEVEDYLADIVPQPVSCDNWLYAPSAGSKITIGDLDVSGNKITIEALFDYSEVFGLGTSNGGYLVSKHIVGSEVSYSLFPAGCEITTDVSGHKILFAPCVFESDKTYHVAMVYDGTTLKFYRNGFLMVQTACTGNIVNNDLLTTIAQMAIGAASPAVSQFSGFVNEVRIWNTDRTQEEIRANMNLSLLNPTTQTGLLAYFIFDNLLNKQGNSAWNGTLMGSAVINQINPECTFVVDSCEVPPPPPPVIASFTVPDTVCVNTPVAVTNTSQNATNYYWNFCGINTNAVPVVTNMGNVGGSMLQPVYSEVVEDNGNYYLFVSNYTGGTGGLVRLDFGNSLLNTPIPVNYGNFGGVLPYISKGIQVRKHNSNWYVIMIGQASVTSTSELSVINFGANITNPNPAANNWGNVANVSSPWDLYIFKEGTNWYGYTTSVATNSLIRLNFGTDFSGTPIATNLGNLGVFNSPTGIGVIKNGSDWFMFFVDHRSIIRLDFGNSLLNTPSIVNLGDFGNIFNLAVSETSDISFVRLCNSIQGIVVVGGGNRIFSLDFGNNLLNTPVPALLSLGIIGMPSSVSNVFVSGDKIGAFVTSPMGSRLYRVEFASGCTDIPSSKLKDPLPFSYTQPGTYNINLLVDVGLPTQTAICKQIVVVSPTSLQVPTKNIEICEGDSIKIGASSSVGPYLWSTGAVSDSIHVKADGAYWVEMNHYGCVYRDSVNLTIDIPLVLASNDTIICKGNIVQLNAAGAQTYSWSPVPGLSATNIANPVATPVTTTEYIVTGTNANGCTAKDTVLVDIFSDAAISLTNDTLICKNTSVQLFAGGGITYSWTSDGTLSNTSISNPVASPSADTKYYVSITDNNTCNYVDSVTVSIRPDPVFSVNSPAPICLNDSAQLIASGGNLYSWQQADGLNNTGIANPRVSPVVNTTYTVTITETACNESTTLSTTVTVLPLPDVQATKSNDIDCSNDQSQLNATGGQSYSWSPFSNLSNSNSPNPVARPTINTQYIVKGTDAAGCENYDSVTVNVDNVNRGGYLMPTAFTPNGDGLNDCYGIRYWGVVQEVDFSIYNRWGQRIFYTKDPSQCWDGTYKGVKQGTDVFVFVISAKTSCDDAVFRKGTFTLIR